MPKVGFSIKFSPPDVARMVAEIGDRLPAFIISTVDEVSDSVLAQVKANTYRAENDYWHYWNGGLTKQLFSAGTMSDLLYQFTMPLNETNGVYTKKIALLNNNETGYMGNVAVLFEYGFYDRPPMPFFRPAVKIGQSKMRSAVKSNLQKTMNQDKAEIKPAEPNKLRKPPTYKEFMKELNRQLEAMGRK